MMQQRSQRVSGTNALHQNFFLEQQLNLIVLFGLPSYFISLSTYLESQGNLIPVCCHFNLSVNLLPFLKKFLFSSIGASLFKCLLNKLISNLCPLCLHFQCI